MCRFVCVLAGEFLSVCVSMRWYCGFVGLCVCVFTCVFVFMCVLVLIFLFVGVYVCLFVSEFVGLCVCASMTV